MIGDICVFLLYRLGSIQVAFVSNWARPEMHSIFIYLTLCSSHTLSHTSLCLVIPRPSSLLSEFHFFSNPFFNFINWFKLFVESNSFKNAGKGWRDYSLAKSMPCYGCVLSVLKPTSVVSQLPSIPSLGIPCPCPPRSTVHTGTQRKRHRHMVFSKHAHYMIRKYAS